jgi:hypothetical protein
MSAEIANALVSFSQGIFALPEPLLLLIFGIGMIAVSKSLKLRTRMIARVRPVQETHAEPLGKPLGTAPV